MTLYLSDARKTHPHFTLSEDEFLDFLQQTETLRYTIDSAVRHPEDMEKHLNYLKEASDFFFFQKQGYDFSNTSEACEWINEYNFPVPQGSHAPDWMSSACNGSSLSENKLQKRPQDITLNQAELTTLLLYMQTLVPPAGTPSTHVFTPPPRLQESDTRASNGRTLQKLLSQEDRNVSHRNPFKPNAYKKNYR